MSQPRRDINLGLRLLRGTLWLHVMLLVTRAYAEPIHYLGFISYDVLVPGAPEAPGVNIFNISNFTGDPLLAGFGLPPDFDVFTFLTFRNSTLSIDGGPPVALGDISPGSFSSPLLEFPDTATFSSAAFSALLSSTLLARSDGTTFEVSTDLITVLLSPTSGSSLVAGMEFSLIQVSEAVPSEIPEPSTARLWLIAVGFVSLARAVANRVGRMERRQIR